LKAQRRREVLQVAEGALLAEQEVDEAAGGREVGIVGIERTPPCRPEDLEIDRPAVGHRTGLEEAWQSTGMVHMKVRQQHDVGPTQRQLGFTQAHERSRAGVDENTRHAIHQHHEGRARAAGGTRAARAQHHEFQRRRGGRLGLSCERGGQRAHGQTKCRQAAPAGVGQSFHSILCAGGATTGRTGSGKPPARSCGAPVL